MTSANPYTVLGVRPGVSIQEVTKAYRKISRKHHPDIVGHETPFFSEVTRAYQLIREGKVALPKFLVHDSSPFQYREEVDPQ